ncbi:glycosyltransferase [Bacillaceae bacterium YX66]
MRTYGVYFMIHSLDVVRGGMTRAALERAKLLRAHFPEIGLITFDYNPEYDNVLNELKSVNLWDNHMRHVNVYEFFMQKHINGNVGRHHIGELPTDDVYEKQEVSDQYGQVRKLMFIDRRSNNLYKDYFFSSNGSCFFERKFDSVTGKTLKCTWFCPNGEEKRTFNKVKDYRDFFIRSIIKKHDDVILLSDGRFSDKVLFAVKDPRIAKVALLHSHHLQAPYHYGSRLVTRNESLIKHVNKLDAFVTLTEQQAEDICSRFGHISTIYTVGHPVPVLQPLVKKQDYEPYTAVIVARYDGIKQIPHAIKAFKKVIKKIPQAQLEIWGFGKEEALYRRLIAKLKLENNVLIKGFTKNTEAVFRRAAFSVMTSKSEAFAMSIIESMSVGTPVICYACHYGPLDLIKHKKNGILIEPNDVNGLANAMIELFQNKQKRNTLSREALKIVEQYSREKTAQKWVTVFEYALRQKEQRVHLSKMTARFTSFIYVAEEQSFRFEGELHLQKNTFTSNLKKHIRLSLQLRRQKQLLDQYVPLPFKWVDDHNKIIFHGKLSNALQWETGVWKLNLSFSCLNDCKFVTIKGSEKWTYESPMYKLEKLKIKLYLSNDSVTMKVLRSNEKRSLNFQKYREHLKEHYKQKLKSHLVKAGFFK